jgi:hypothetical protein
LLFRRAFLGSEIFACEIPGVLENFFGEEKKKEQPIVTITHQIIKNSELTSIKGIVLEDEFNENQVISIEKWDEEYKSDDSDEIKKTSG